VKLTVNGESFEVEDRHRETPLLWGLRDVLDLRGTKFGCGGGGAIANRADIAISYPPVTQTGGVYPARGGNGTPENRAFCRGFLTERRRSRTYQPWDYHGLPVLKIERVWLNEGA
jgi:hypothetical protein